MPFYQLSTSVRSLNRLRQIARVLVRNGFGHIVEQLNLVRHLPFGRLFGAGEPEPADVSESSLGRRLAAVCAELGPTFVKLGQMVSTRPDLLPPDILRDLRRLQDRVPPFASDVARSIIAEQIGGPIEEHFAEIEAEPFASGSIGQVYNGRTKAGEDVVVKVKRPGVDHTVRLDLHLLKWLAAAAEQFVAELARYKPLQIVEEFELLLTAEMDYIREAAATASFADTLTDDPHVHIPRVRWDLTGPRVLTMSRVHGRNFEELLEADLVGIDRKLLAQRLVHLYLKQFFELGRFHADPHPGNFLVSAPATLAIVDFGQVGTLSDELAGQLVVIIVALTYREPQVVVDVLSDMGAIDADADARGLARALRVLLDKYYGLPIKRIELTAFFFEFTDLVRRHNITLPRELVTVLKTLVTIAGMALRLDPELDLVTIVRPRLRQLLTDRVSPPRLARWLGVTAWHTLSILKSAPGQLRGALRQIGRGKWQVAIRHENLDRLTNELDRSSNRLAFAILIAAIIIGSSVVIAAGSAAPVLGVPVYWVGVAGYLVAAMLGIGLIWAIIRSGRLY